MKLMTGNYILHHVSNLLAILAGAIQLLFNHFPSVSYRFPAPKQKPKVEKRDVCVWGPCYMFCC